MSAVGAPGARRLEVLEPIPENVVSPGAHAVARCECPGAGLARPGKVGRSGMANFSPSTTDALYDFIGKAACGLLLFGKSRRTVP